MFPKWFDKWDRDNPTDVERPAIIVGAVGTAVIAVIALVALGQPFATDSLQTGPRGNGMSVPAFKADLARPDPTIAAYLASTSDPVVPQGGAQTAGAARENVPPGLEDLTVENYDRLLAAMRAWTGIPDLFDDPDNYQTAVGHLMIQMTQNINENWAGHVNANKQVGVTCFTCHRGEAVPSDIWFEQGAVTASTAGWAATQNLVTPLSSYTSLPSSALKAYLVEGEPVNVHSLESRVAGRPGEDGYASIQKTEQTYALMNYFANSLGVNCVFCHNSRAFYAAAGQMTPQWGTALLGRQMVNELNNTYLIPAGGLLPESRLGPVMGDAPKVSCRTCHKGYQRPLQGTDVIGDWPELATTGPAPNYSN